MAVVVRGVAEVNAALAALALGIGKRQLRNLSDAGVIYVVGRGRSQRVPTIVNEIEREIDQAIRLAGF